MRDNYSSSSNRLGTSVDSSWATHDKTTTTYSYDLAGSRTKDTVANKLLQAYQYDAAGRMKGSVLVAPARVISPGGVTDTLVQRRNANSCGYNADGQLVRGCGVSRVSYVGANVVREHNGDWWYVGGPGLDEPLLAVRRGSGNVAQLWLPVVSDDRGQLIAIADSVGELQGTLIGPQYDAGLWNSSGLTSHSQSFNPRRWATPGGIDTISTFRSRQYDPATGTWMQEDRVGLAGGINLYEYNGNDPNSFSDPFGLCPTEVGGDGKTATFVDCPKGTKGFDMVGAVGHPMIDPVALAAGGIAGAVEGAIGAVSGAAGSATAAESSLYEDATWRATANRVTDVSRAEFEGNLAKSGYTRVQTNTPGVVRFAKDAVSYTTRPVGKSVPGAAADLRINGETVLKIRLGPEGSP